MIKIDGLAFKKAVLSGAYNLEHNKKAVDDLNVFPVPDGDTGTNMSLTFSAAAKELLSRDDNLTTGEYADSIASASLRGARGNSGVILSQLLRGFAKSTNGKSELTVFDLADALSEASKAAYKAVMKPTEGTMLTVSKDCAAAAAKIAEQTEDITEFVEKVIEAAVESVNNTPNLLPILKQSGVVDAGGMGLVIIAEGVLASLKGEDISATGSIDAQISKLVMPKAAQNIEFLYCTEFLIKKNSTNKSTVNFRAAIEPMGDSMLVIDDDDIVKVHIHTNAPGFVLTQALKLGELSNMKIDNMKEQAQDVEISAAPSKKYGIITISAGEGLSRVFTDFGVDQIVMGGQSMNPSTDDILTAANAINAENIIVLPNNKNIILAATQAAEICEKKLLVIPTKTIPQGITALLAFDPTREPDENVSAMTESLSTVKTGMVTFASRDSVVDGREIKENEILGLCEGDIEFVGKNPEEVAFDVVMKLVNAESSVISLFYGEGTSKKKAEKLVDKLTETSDYDVFAHEGGQPLYYYIISVE